MYFKYFVKYFFTNVFEIQNQKIHLCILYFTKYFTKYMYKISQYQRIFSNNMVQTMARLMFNKFKQDCFDVKATASRMIHLAVHFNEEPSVLRHWIAAQHFD